MSDFRQEFLAFALARDVLRFGEFVTKAGRRSPYFFNAGLFNDGASLRALGRFYAEAWLASGVGLRPALRAGVQGHHAGGGDGDRAGRNRAQPAVQLQSEGGEGPRRGRRRSSARALAGRVLIVDDVITAGTSVRESVELIRAQGAMPAGVLIALDRMERGQGECSAVQEVRDAYGIPVVAIATLDDVMRFIAGRPDLEPLAAGGERVSRTSTAPAPPRWRAARSGSEPGVERQRNPEPGRWQ